MPIDYDAAASLNPYFASVTVPPWNASFNEVKTVLGLGGTQPTAKDFADAVHWWQIDNCRTRDDGILDQATWDALRPHTMFCVEAEPLPTWLADFGVPLDEGDDVPLSGQIPITGGIAAVVRIPVPGNGKLGIEFFPRNFKGDSTSTLFIQNIKGNKTLRLDYGYNKVSNTIDYHWNQKGTHAKFGITDHQTVGKAGQMLYKGAKYYRYAGRVLVVVGATLDAISIVKASKPLRRATAVVSAWALAWVGCKVVGKGGAAAGTFVEPGLGTAIGGVAGCIVGGGVGYWGGEKLGETVYDWAEGTFFTELDRIKS